MSNSILKVLEAFVGLLVAAGGGIAWHAWRLYRRHENAQYPALEITMRHAMLKLAFVFHKLLQRWFPPKRNEEAK